MTTFTEKLNKAGCPYAFYPNVLLNIDFSSAFMTGVKSKLYPTICQLFTDNCNSMVCVATKARNDSDYLLGFGYLYSYCVDKGLPDKLLPKYVVRDELQEALDAHEYDLLYTKATLFIDLVDSNDDYYSKEEIRKFSNYLYARSIKGYKTVLCLQKPTSECSSVTQFIRSYLSTRAPRIALED